MREERPDPLAVMLSFAEKIHAISGDLLTVVTCAVFEASWLVVLGLLFILVDFAHLEFLRVVLVLFSAVTSPIIGIISFLIILIGYNVRKTLMKWDKAFSRFSYGLRFETYPAEGNTLQERIFKQLLKVFPMLGDSFLDYEKKRPRAEEDFLNVQIKGKKGEHVFDVYIGRQVLKTRSKLSKHIDAVGPIFVKCFEKEEPVDEGDISRFRDEIADCLAFRERRIFGIIAVSTSSFAESAKEYVRDERNRVGGSSFDLIIEGPKGYHVEWIF